MNLEMRVKWSESRGFFDVDEFFVEVELNGLAEASFLDNYYAGQWLGRGELLQLVSRIACLSGDDFEREQNVDGGGVIVVPQVEQDRGRVYLFEVKTESPNDLVRLFRTLDELRSYMKKCRYVEPRGEEVTLMDYRQFLYGGG